MFSEVPKDNTHESMLVKHGERNVIRFIANTISQNIQRGGK